MRLRGDWPGRPRAPRASGLPASEAPPRSGAEPPSERAGLRQSSAPCSCPAAQWARAMASGSVAECLQQETTCPVCLQYFAEPMMLDCGHNICCACLARCWGAAETNVSCPQCRETFPQRHMRPNRHLANVTQLVKQLRTERPSGPGGEMGVCEKHREPLKLYCEQDQMPICVVCDRSREHRGHSVLPLEEAVEGFKVGPGRAGGQKGASRGLCWPAAEKMASRTWGPAPSFPPCRPPSLRAQDSAGRTCSWPGQRRPHPHRSPPPPLQHPTPPPVNCLHACGAGTARGDAPLTKEVHLEPRPPARGLGDLEPELAPGEQTERPLRARLNSQPKQCLSLNLCPRHFPVTCFRS